MNSIRSTLIVYLRRILRAIYAVRLRRYPTLRAVLERFSRSKSAAVDLADAIALYEYVIERKPACILELGPGTSTNIICQAIVDIQKGDPSYSPRFLSYEENPEWLRFHEETFVPELRKHVELGALGTSMEKLDGGGGGRLITLVCQCCLTTLFSLMGRIFSVMAVNGRVMCLTFPMR